MMRISLFIRYKCKVYDLIVYWFMKIRATLYENLNLSWFIIMRKGGLFSEPSSAGNDGGCLKQTYLVFPTEFISSCSCRFQMPTVLVTIFITYEWYFIPDLGWVQILIAWDTQTAQEMVWRSCSGVADDCIVFD